MPSCLVVDDIELNRDVIATEIFHLGFQVDKCANGKEALDYCEGHPMPDLIILDYVMPVLDGPSFLKKLRLMDNGTKPYVILCSALVSSDELRQGLNFGANDFLAKPFSDTQMRTALKKAGLYKPFDH